MQQNIAQLNLDFPLTEEAIAENEARQKELRGQFALNPAQATRQHYLLRRDELTQSLELMQKQTVRDLSLERRVQNEIADCERLLND